MARLFPLVLPKNGLSLGMVPSLLMRRTLPMVVFMSWAREPTVLSPTEM
jgi:hypothetical protein